MLMNGKKGIAAEQLVVIIIVIAAFMLIAGVVTRALAKADDKQAENLCRDSIAIRAATSISTDGTFVKGEAKLAPVLCKTIDKKVSGDREEIKQQIANSLARCWWMFGEGRYEQILDNGAVAPAFYSLDKTENDCFVCYAELIKEDSFETITTEEFYRYLSKTNYPSVKDTTYLDYIQKYRGPGAVVLFSNIEAQKAYGISFLSKNKKSEGTPLSGVEKALAGTGIAAGTGAALGAAGCVASGICVVLAVGGGLLAAAVAVAGIQDIMVPFFKTERDISMVMLSDSKTAQQRCFKGDIAGE